MATRRDELPKALPMCSPLQALNLAATQISLSHSTKIRNAVCVISLLGVSIASGCSHTLPYVRPDSSPGITSGILPDDTLRTRLILVGDAGEADAAVLGEVAVWAGQSPDRTLVIFLGDNMYPEGMTRRRRGEADRRILPQIDAATGGGARALFVPGNHDWADGGAEGYEAVLAEAEYVADRLPHESGFLPLDACPGPVAVDRLPGLRIVAVDTQWWLHEGSKPTETCPQSSPQEFAAELSRLMDTDRDVVIAAHHPLDGFGRHAGFSDWKEHLLPPLIGTVIAMKRKLWPSNQEFKSGPYQAMTELFESALPERSEDRGLLLWAAGHEHSLQVLDGKVVDYVLVSGSAAKTTPVGHGPGTIFAQSQPGFMVLDFLTSGRTRLRIIEPGGDEVYAMWLRTTDTTNRE